MDELWAPVPGFELTHAVSNLGRVMSLTPRRGGRKSEASYRHGRDSYIMRPHPKKPKGYLKVRIGLCGEKRKNFVVHRLVAMVFIPNPHNKPQVNHIDGCKTNNTVTNLEWVTNQENCIHTYAAGITIRATGEKSPFAKLTDTQIAAIRADNRTHLSIAREYGVTRGHISRIKAGKCRT